ncbi:2-oxo-4-hydroxy-4-carboxy-5-ureidoimidazoline decarboxylase [Isoptericola jiangsuensis]|uniref:2-oxo-4-hydroxy-4-carboxy-5-ureidoimidazoline decarboxylase n=1 Tax=Isoptericola jiangsuensis TaxID=548579 RepID=A0A2A9EU90_9MICO|nr:2-oxo-4-hydroxy-4-carboxy-5-ureidoimidazoline decarboxylase [Isoptericola jiangsuensis]PFG42594.1 2-oxo-4-hydroxy-4-carboxy-5-ureidoimidazoline decarboxylase [Isoptericola jiangsuensis]
MHIDDFDTLDAATATATVAVWAAVPTWTDAVVAGRPYGTTAALAAHAAALATTWGRPELDAALAHHPRIGERPTGDGAEAAASRREQASMTTADDDVAARLAAGNRAYEERFGRVFLVRAAGRTPDEMLAELERRLHHDDATEVAEACDQLAQIALLRLRGDVTDPEDHP